MSLLATQHFFEQARDQALADRGLPELAFLANTFDKSLGAPPVIGIRRGESGYYPVFTEGFHARTAENFRRPNFV